MYIIVLYNLRQCCSKMFAIIIIVTFKITNEYIDLKSVETL